MALTPIPSSDSPILNLLDDLNDPVHFEPMTDAVTLVPCGHTVSEKTAKTLMGRKLLCPLGREPIEKYVPNFVIRNLASPETIKNLESSLSRQHSGTSEVSVGPSAEAMAHLEKGKKLHEQKKYEEAVGSFIAALSLYPNYEKAQAYLESSLEAQKNIITGPATSLAVFNSPSVESVVNLEKGKALYDQKKYPEAASSFIAALSLYPNYEKAQAFLESSLEAQRTATSVPAIIPEKEPAVDIKKSLPEIAEYQAPSSSDVSMECVPLNRIGRERALIRAAETGNIGLVQQLIALDTNVNVKNHKDESPLLIATAKNHVEIVCILIGNGADLRAEGQTALEIAARQNNKEIVRILIDEKVNPMRCKKDGNNYDAYSSPAFIAATGQGDTELMILLLDNGVFLGALTGMPYYGQRRTIGDDALLITCRNRNRKGMELLIERGVDLNGCISYSNIDSERRTIGQEALLTACFNGDVDIVRCLLEKKIDLLGKAGEDILMAACQHAELLQLLPIDLSQRHSASRYSKSQSITWGKCALQQANTNKWWNSVLCLLKKGVDIQESNDYGQTIGEDVLSNACHSGATEVVRELLAKGIILPQRQSRINDLKRSCFEQAGLLGHTEIAQLLLDHGVDTHSSSRWDKTKTVAQYVLIESCQNGNIDIVQLFLTNRIDIQEVRSDAIESAREAGHVNIVELLSRDFP